MRDLGEGSLFIKNSVTRARVDTLFLPALILELSKSTLLAACVLMRMEINWLVVSQFESDLDLEV